MYHTSSGFPTMDYWSNDMGGYTANGLTDELGSGFRTSPELGRPSQNCSPDPLTLADKCHLPPFEMSVMGSSQHSSLHPLHQSTLTTTASASATAMTTTTTTTTATTTTKTAMTPAAPFQPPTVSYLPETVNAVWGMGMGLGLGLGLTHRAPAFDKLCPPKKYTFEASQCCAAPRIRIVHDCCNKETPVRELVDEGVLSRRVYPAKLTLCRFCLKNGEPPSVYYSHSLHQDDGRVACPVLRRYDCPICKNGGGDYAHTVRYCPALRASIRR